MARSSAHANLSPMIQDCRPRRRTWAIAAHLKGKLRLLWAPFRLRFGADVPGTIIWPLGVARRHDAARKWRQSSNIQIVGKRTTGEPADLNQLDSDDLTRFLSFPLSSLNYFWWNLLAGFFGLGIFVAVVSFPFCFVDDCPIGFHRSNRDTNTRLMSPIHSNLIHSAGLFHKKWIQIEPILIHWNWSDAFRSKRNWKPTIETSYKLMKWNRNLRFCRRCFQPGSWVGG